MAALFRLMQIAWETWRFRRGDGEAIARRQQARLQELVRHARTASPYYRELYRHLPPGAAVLHSLPVTNKRDLMAHFDDWVTDPEITLEAVRRDFLSDPSLTGALYLGRYHVVTTSGTSGHPAVLVHDADSWALLSVLSRRGRWQFVGRWDVILGMARRGLRVAALFVVGRGHFGAAAALESARRRGRSLARRFRVFDVLRPLPDLVAELNLFQPTAIEGYPSAVELLATEQRAGRLRIEPVLIVTAGEVLSTAVRTAVETTFGCPVVNNYGSAEFVALAVECRHGRFHVNSDWFLVEAVDGNYRPVPPGVSSHTVLVTNLANRVQPLIRYDLGDRVTMAVDPCACGNRLPAMTVEGRTGDLLTFESAQGNAIKVLPLALGTVIEETPGVRRFQAIRTGRRTLQVRLETSPGADPGQVWETLDHRLSEFFNAQGIAAVSVEHAQESPSVDPRSGKFRQVWSVSGE
jgi:phenylacetate-coenzyme A ligase PaaK-like adenylate-forming protein